MVSTGLEGLDAILPQGIPERSATLIVGPPGVGKEAVCYWFLSASLREGAAAIYVSRHPASELIEDARGYGVRLDGPIINVDCSGLPSTSATFSCNLSEITGLSLTLKKVVAENGNRKVRIVLDILSPLLLLNSLENIYKFLSSLLLDFKKYDTVLLATVEEGMHSSREIVSFEQLFDGVIELRLYEKDLRVMPLLQVKKMRGLAAQPGFYKFRFDPSGMFEIGIYAR